MGSSDMSIGGQNNMNNFYKKQLIPIIDSDEEAGY